MHRFCDFGRRDFDGEKGPAEAEPSTLGVCGRERALFRSEAIRGAADGFRDLQKRIRPCLSCNQKRFASDRGSYIGKPTPLNELSRGKTLAENSLPDLHRDRT
jgi:hypothetical protein